MMLNDRKNFVVGRHEMSIKKKSGKNPRTCSTIKQSKNLSGFDLSIARIY